MTTTRNRSAARSTTRSSARRPAARTSAPRIAIMPYGPSNSVTALKQVLEERGHQVVKLRRDGSTFRGNENDLIINWGNSQIPQAELQTIAGRGRLLNPPQSIRLASMKTDAFRAMQGAGVPLVEWTTSRAEAQRWVDDGGLVYGRTRLQGHSGEGIVMTHRDPASIEGVGNAFAVMATLPNAPLYTKGITAQRREFRIHVMNGRITYVQQKKRAEGFRDNPAYSNVVRNYHTGWIYATTDVRPNDAALRAAVDAVSALSLDFGAVDVITRHNDAWVLEVNTAPGLQGTNLTTYSENFAALFTNQPVNSAFDIPAQSNATAAPAPAPQPAPVEQPVAVQVAHAAADALRSANDNPTTRNRAATQRQVAGQGITARHNAFYEATLNGTRVIVQYNEDVEGFYMPGWEIPMAPGRDEGFVVALNAEI